MKNIHCFSQQGSTPHQANQIYSHYNGRFVYTPSYFPFYQPQSDVYPPNLAVPGIDGCQTVASSKRPRQRRDWTDTETSLLWELYETAYSLGKLTSKTTKANSGGWENLEKDFNRELASRNMPPRSLQQMKEKINNLKSDHKKIKDKETQTGQENQAKPFWFDMVDRVFGCKDEIEPPFLFDSSKGGYENKRKATNLEEDEGRMDQLGNEDDVFAPSTSKGAGKRKADRDRGEASNLEQAPGKKLRKTARSEKAQKADDEGSSKELINVLDKQVKFLQEAQERDDKMMERMLQLEEKSEERQKEILMAIINKL